MSATAWAATINPKLAEHPFLPTGLNETHRAGWVAPASHAPDLLAYPVGEAVILDLCVETRAVPAEILKKEVKKRIELIEAGWPDIHGNPRERKRQVDRQEAKEIKDAIHDELLPRAFPKTTTVRLWWLPVRGWIWVEGTNANLAEQATAALRKTLDSLPSRIPAVREDPAHAMTRWLELGPPNDFTLDGDCKLVPPGDSGKSITLVGHDLHTQEIQALVQMGTLVQRLAMTWSDRISFVLTDKAHIKNIEALGLIDEAIRNADWKDSAEAFDGTATLIAGELCALIDALMQAMGGLITEATSENTDLVERQSAETDPLFMRALDVLEKCVSISPIHLQQELMIGYNRASRLLDRMEECRLISPPSNDGERHRLGFGSRPS